MKPKEFIRYTQILDKRGLAICDGVTENMDLGGVLYPLFIMSGFSFFIWLMLKWDDIKRFISSRK